MARRNGDSAVARLAQVAIVVRMYRELVERFNDMKFIDLDLVTGQKTEAEIEDPEFGYQMLGIIKSLLGALEPLVVG